MYNNNINDLEVDSMKKALILVPLGAAAVGAAVFFAMKKPAGEKAAPAKKAASGGKKKEAPAMNLQPGSYTFISGFQDAAKVEAGFQYDANTCDFAVISEEYPAYSSDSHVAVVRCPEFIVQLEYAGYYGGEDFGGLKKSLAERYQDIVDASCGGNQALRFIDGDNVCLAVGVDQFSYLLVTLIKGKEYDDDFKTLPDYPPVKAVLDSLKFSEGK